MNTVAKLLRWKICPSIADEQPSKKKRNGQYVPDDIERPIFSTEVVILDRNKKCHLSSGDYEFVLHEQGADFKNASWETVMNGKVQSTPDNGCKLGENWTEMKTCLCEIYVYCQIRVQIEHNKQSI